MSTLAPEATELTVGTIARILGVRFSRAAYLIDSRGIQPISRSGIVRNFDAAVIDQLRAEINAIDAKRRPAVSH